VCESANGTNWHLDGRSGVKATKAAPAELWTCLCSHWSAASTSRRC